MSSLLKYGGIVAGVVLISAGVITALSIGIDNDHFARVVGAINTDLSSTLFISLMVVLPALGFPISLFLVVAGIKFGFAWAFLIWLVVLPFHTVIAYLAVRFFRPRLQNLLNRMFGYTLPTIPAHRQAFFSLLFLAIPGVPYGFKNYLLPMAGVSIVYCIPLNILIQSVLGLPYIILGRSGAEMNLTLFLLALLLFFCIYLVLRWTKRKYRQVPPPKRKL